MNFKTRTEDLKKKSSEISAKTELLLITFHFSFSFKNILYWKKCTNSQKEMINKHVRADYTSSKLKMCSFS